MNHPTPRQQKEDGNGGVSCSSNNIIYIIYGVSSLHLLIPFTPALKHQINFAKEDTNMA